MFQVIASVKFHIVAFCVESWRWGLYVPSKYLRLSIRLLQAGGDFLHSTYHLTHSPTLRHPPSSGLQHEMVSSPWRPQYLSYSIRRRKREAGRSTHPLWRCRSLNFTPFSEHTSIPFLWFQFVQLETLVPLIAFSEGPHIVIWSDGHYNVIALVMVLGAANNNSR